MSQIKKETILEYSKELITLVKILSIFVLFQNLRLHERTELSLYSNKQAWSHETSISHISYHKLKGFVG